MYRNCICRLNLVNVNLYFLIHIPCFWLQFHQQPDPDGRENEARRIQLEKNMKYHLLNQKDCSGKRIKCHYAFSSNRPERSKSKRQQIIIMACGLSIVIITNPLIVCVGRANVSTPNGNQDNNYLFLVLLKGSWMGCHPLGTGHLFLRLKDDQQTGGCRDTRLFGQELKLLDNMVTYWGLLYLQYYCIVS